MTASMLHRQQVRPHPLSESRAVVDAVRDVQEKEGHKKEVMPTEIHTDLSKWGSAELTQKYLEMMRPRLDCLPEEQLADEELLPVNGTNTTNTTNATAMEPASEMHGRHP